MPMPAAPELAMVRVQYSLKSARKISVELTILKIAKQNDGVVSVADVALQARVPTAEAQRELDGMVERGQAQMHVRKSGALAYTIPDFSPQGHTDFEDV